MSSKLWPKGLLYSTCCLLAFLGIVISLAKQPGSHADNVASTLQVQNNIRRDYTNLGPPTQQNPEVAPAVPIIDISKQYIQQASSNLTRRDANPCTPQTPCLDGSCCSTGGTCGYGPNYCGAGNCTSNCNSKAMCGIYSDGGLSCGMNLCCSHYGWCGTDQAHCGDIDPNGQAPCQKGYGLCEIIPPPSCVQGSGSTNGRSIGYYQASNTRDRLCNRISPSQINLDGLTHLYFAFAKFDATSYQMVPGDSGDIELYTQFTALQSKGVKTWIAVGGFDFSDPGTTRTAWSNMTASSAGRSAFITSLKSFMQKYKFQGVDLDWEYPGTPERGGQRADTQNFLALVKEMRASFGSQYGISLTLAPDYWYLRGFAAKEMEPYVDFFGFMAYDLHGSWDTDVKTLGSIVRGQADIRDISNDTLPLWFDKLNPTKLNFGLAYYGRGYTLANPSCNTLGCPFSGPSKPGICTNYGGVMSLLEIQNLIKQKGLTPKLLPDSMMKQITWDNQWIGYDDADTIKLKKAWADGQCFGGTMIWSVDFNSGSGSGDVPSNTTDGSCGPAHGGTVCGDWSTGSCCSASGYCGSDAAHCGNEPVVSTGRIPSAVHLQAAAAARARATVGATMPIAVLAVNQAALRQMGPAGSLRNTIPAKALCTGTAALRMGIVEAMLRTVEPAAKTVTVSQELQTSLPTAHVARPLARSVAIGQMAAAVLRPHIVVMTMHTAVLAVNQALVYGPARMTVSVKAQIVTTDNVQGRCAWLSAASARVAPKANAHFPPYVYRKGVSALTASMASVLATVAPRVAAKENNALRPQGTARAMTALALDVTDRTVILIPVAVSIGPDCDIDSCTGPDCVDGICVGPDCHDSQFTSGGGGGSEGDDPESCTSKTTATDCATFCSVKSASSATTLTTDCYTTICESSTGCNIAGSETASTTTSVCSGGYKSGPFVLGPFQGPMHDNSPATGSATATGPITSPATTRGSSTTTGAANTNYISCSHRNQDPGDNILTAYCVCDSSTFAESVVEAGTTANSCAYTTKPTSTLGQQTGPPQTTNTDTCQVCSVVGSNNNECTSLASCTPKPTTPPSSPSTRCITAHVQMDNCAIGGDYMVVQLWDNGVKTCDKGNNRNGASDETVYNWDCGNGNSVRITDNGASMTYSASDGSISLKPFKTKKDYSPCGGTDERPITGSSFEYAYSNNQCSKCHVADLCDFRGFCPSFDGSCSS